MNNHYFNRNILGWRGFEAFKETVSEKVRETN